MSDLSETIAALRKSADETQAALAEALGVSNRTISKWENAESEPEAAYLVALADHFSVSVDGLLGHAPRKPDPFAAASSFGEAAAAFHGTLKDAVEGLTDWAFHFSDRHNWDEPDPPPITPPVPWDEGMLEKQRKNGWDVLTERCVDSNVSAHLTATDEINLVTALFPNRDNYGWLDRRAEELADALGRFADPRVLRFLRRMHTPDFPKKFTLEQAAALAGMPEAELEPVLTILMGPPLEAELTEGTAKLWQYWYGDASVLTFLSAAYLALLPHSTCCVRGFNNVCRPMIPKEQEGAR